MKNSNTNYKGDIASTKIMLDLTEKGYIVFIPAMSHSLKYDLVAHKDNIFYKIQCKYISKKGYVPNPIIHYKYKSKDTISKYKYDEDDFHYYAIYLSEIDKILYPNISFGGITISYNVPNSLTPFYWWEDFLQFTDNVNKTSILDFGLYIKGTTNKDGKVDFFKIPIPPKDLLYKLVWEKPIEQIAHQFGVSVVSIKGFIKHYKLEHPIAGYWRKNKIIDTTKNKSLNDLYKEYNSNYYESR